MSSSSSTLPGRGGSTPLNSHDPAQPERRSGRDRRRTPRPANGEAPPTVKPRTRAIFFEALHAAGISQKRAALTLGIDAATLSRMASGDPTAAATPKLTTEIVDRARALLGDGFRAEFRRRMAAEYGLGVGGDAPLVAVMREALAILDKLAAAQLAGQVA